MNWQVIFLTWKNTWFRIGFMTVIVLLTLVIRFEDSVTSARLSVGK